MRRALQLGRELARWLSTLVQNSQSRLADFSVGRFNLTQKRSQAVRADLEAALKRGADELMARAEYALRHEPGALARVRHSYHRFCLVAYRAIERFR